MQLGSRWRTTIELQPHRVVEPVQKIEEAGGEGQLNDLGLIE